MGEGDRHAQRAFLSCPHEALGPGPDPCILARSVQLPDPQPEIQKAQFHATETLGKSQPSLNLHFPICPMGTGPRRRGNQPLCNALRGSRHGESPLLGLASPTRTLLCRIPAVPHLAVSPHLPPRPPDLTSECGRGSWKEALRAREEEGLAQGPPASRGLCFPAYVLVTTPRGSRVRALGSQVLSWSPPSTGSWPQFLHRWPLLCRPPAFCLPTSFPAWGWGPSLAARPDPSPGCASPPTLPGAAGRQ